MSCGFSWSTFCKAITSWIMLFVLVCVESPPASWEWGNHSASLDSSDLGIFSNAFTYWLASSWFVYRIWRSSGGLTGSIFFAWFGVNSEKVATPAFLCFYGCSKEILISTVYCRLCWLLRLDSCWDHHCVPEYGKTEFFFLFISLFV